MEKSFLKIVDENQAIIYKVCRMYRDSKEDQEDLFQEIVLQLWKAFPKFREESKISTWMYRIALNTALAIFRKNKNGPTIDETILINYKVDEGQASSENEERMFEAFRKLSDTERAIVALFLEDYSHKEIAHFIGITENNVGVKVNRIKEKLKNILN